MQAEGRKASSLYDRILMRAVCANLQLPQMTEPDELQRTWRKHIMSDERMGPLT